MDDATYSSCGRNATSRTWCSGTAVASTGWTSPWCDRATTLTRTTTTGTSPEGSTRLSAGCGTSSPLTRRRCTWWRTCWSRSILTRPGRRAARVTGWRCTSTGAKAAVGARASASAGSTISSSGHRPKGLSNGASPGGWRRRSGSGGTPSDEFSAIPERFLKGRRDRFDPVYEPVARPGTPEGSAAV